MVADGLVPVLGSWKSASTTSIVVNVCNEVDYQIIVISVNMLFAKVILWTQVFTQTIPAISSYLKLWYCLCPTGWGWQLGFSCIYAYAYIICQINRFFYWSVLPNLKLHVEYKSPLSCTRILKCWNDYSSRTGVGHKMFYLCADH